MVVLIEPGIQICLQGVHRLIKFLSKCRADEFVQNGPIKAFHKPIGPRAGNLRGAMLDVVELEKISYRWIVGRPLYSVPLSVRIAWIVKR